MVTRPTLDDLANMSLFHALVAVGHFSPHGVTTGHGKPIYRCADGLLVDHMHAAEAWRFVEAQHRPDPSSIADMLGC